MWILSLISIAFPCSGDAAEQIEYFPLQEGISSEELCDEHSNFISLNFCNIIFFIWIFCFHMFKAILMCIFMMQIQWNTAFFNEFFR